MLNIVLYAPEIPANTGNIGRTCVVTGSRLHLIRPLGFSLDSKLLHRAGLGYWESLDARVHDSWEGFLQENGLADRDGARRLHLLTKKARRTYAETAYRDGDFLVFGSESSGLPEALLAELPGRCERIPMLPDETSLSNRAAWAQRHDGVVGGGAERSAGAGAASGPAREETSPILRQDVCGNFVDPDGYRISALNLSNAAAIVLYEALRQTGFPGM